MVMLRVSLTEEELGMLYQEFLYATKNGTFEYWPGQDGAERFMEFIRLQLRLQSWEPFMHLLHETDEAKTCTRDKPCAKCRERTKANKW